jgi:hypothetical protein
MDVHAIRRLDLSYLKESVNRDSPFIYGFLTSVGAYYFSQHSDFLQLGVF